MGPPFKTLFKAGYSPENGWINVHKKLINIDSQSIKSNNCIEKLFMTTWNGPSKESPTSKWSTMTAYDPQFLMYKTLEL